MSGGSGVVAMSPPAAVCGGRVDDGLSYVGPCDGGGNCCVGDGEMVGLVKRYCRVCR